MHLLTSDGTTDILNLQEVSGRRELNCSKDSDECYSSSVSLFDNSISKPQGRGSIYNEPTPMWARPGLVVGADIPINMLEFDCLSYNFEGQSPRTYLHPFFQIVLLLPLLNSSYYLLWVKVDSDRIFFKIFTLHKYVSFLGRGEVVYLCLNCITVGVLIVDTRYRSVINALKGLNPNNASLAVGQE